jgi:Protein of unknown function (DUF1059)
MGRQIADCRRFESDNACTVTIIGDEEEVVSLAAAHAVADHGHADTPELREMIRSTLEPEESYTPGERQAEPFPA